MKLKVSSCIGIAKAITALDLGYTTVVKLANGEKTAVNEAFDFPSQVRWNLAKNLRILKGIKDDRDAAADASLRALSKGVGILNPEKSPAEFAKHQQAVLDLDAREIDVKGLLKISLSALLGKEDKPNPVPGVILEALAPLIDDNLPAPKKGDELS